MIEYELRILLPKYERDELKISVKIDLKRTIVLGKTSLLD